MITSPLDLSMPLNINCFREQIDSYIKEGGDINKIDENGNSIIDYVLASWHCREEKIKYLVRANAKINDKQIEYIKNRVDWFKSALTLVERKNKVFGNLFMDFEKEIKKSITHYTLILEILQRNSRLRNIEKYK